MYRLSIPNMEVVKFLTHPRNLKVSLSASMLLELHPVNTYQLQNQQTDD
jgi:hypothetical protein